MSAIQNFFTSLPYFVVLIGLLIFVHEGGHFLFAKLFKVKVHVFSLGFGPKLLGFTKGETLYKISLVPIGGYVKMLGEDPSEEVSADDRGRAFGDKPLMQRFLIIIGGPTMNLIFPLVLHFGVGLSVSQVYPSEIGIVIPGMPAHDAGIRPGDSILSINDKPVHSFDDIVRHVSPNPGQKLKVVYQRGEQTFEKTLIPKPTDVPIILDEKETVGRIGVGQGYFPPLLGVPDPESIAAKAGLKTFNLVVSINGQEISRIVDLERRLLDHRGKRLNLLVRDLKEDAAPPFFPVDDQFGEPRQVGLDIPPDASSLLDLGLESSIDYVAHVKAGGPAERIGLKRGDRLLALNGKPYVLGQIYSALDEHPGKTNVLAWMRDGVEFKKPFKQNFIPAGEAGDLGIKRDSYDKGFWGFIGKTVLPEPIPNPTLITGAIRLAIDETWAGLRLIGIGFKLLFQGRVSMRSLGGPIMIGQLAGQAGKEGARTFFWMMALISLNLGLLNLLPIPILDGGQITFIAIEAVTRQPINQTIKERVMLAGVAMILLLMVFATWNDIARLVVG